MFTSTRHCPQVSWQLNCPLSAHELKDIIEEDIDQRKRVPTHYSSNILGILEVS